MDTTRREIVLNTALTTLLGQYADMAQATLVKEHEIDEFFVMAYKVACGEDKRAVNENMPYAFLLWERFFWPGYLPEENRNLLLEYLDKKNKYLGYAVRILDKEADTIQPSGNVFVDEFYAWLLEIKRGTFGKNAVYMFFNKLIDHEFVISSCGLEDEIPRDSLNIMQTPISAIVNEGEAYTLYATEELQRGADTLVDSIISVKIEDMKETEEILHALQDGNQKLAYSIMMACKAGRLYYRNAFANYKESAWDA